jgi:hypothetical protein
MKCPDFEAFGTSDYTFAHISAEHGQVAVSGRSPSAVRWLADHAFSNIGSQDAARSIGEINALARMAAGIVRAQARFVSDNSFTCESDTDKTEVFFIPPHELRDKFLLHLEKQGTPFRPSTPAELDGVRRPAGEILYKGLVTVFASAAEAHSALDEILDPVMLPFDFNELFFSLALGQLDVCAGHCADDNWNNDAMAWYAEAAASCALARGNLNWGIAYNNSDELAATRAARGRWSRLDSVKELAFKRRAEFPNLSRSAAIDRILDELLNACREAGEPLTGGNPKETVTRWFREAGIR